MSTVDRDDLLERTRTGWSVLNDRASHVPEERMTSAPEGTWSGKDQLAHIAMWHRIALARSTGADEDALVGWTAEESASKDIDEVNDRIRELSTERPLGDVRTEFEDSYMELVAAVEGMSQEQLDSLRIPDAPDRGTYAQMIAGNTFEHYEEHIPLLEALARE
jgi:hypothetical protein